MAGGRHPRAHRPRCGWTSVRPATRSADWCRGGGRRRSRRGGPRLDRLLFVGAFNQGAPVASAGWSSVVDGRNHARCHRSRRGLHGHLRRLARRRTLYALLGTSAPARRASRYSPWSSWRPGRHRARWISLAQRCRGRLARRRGGRLGVPRRVEAPAPASVARRRARRRTPGTDGRDDLRPSTGAAGGFPVTATCSASDAGWDPGTRRRRGRAAAAARVARRRCPSSTDGGGPGSANRPRG